jgi:hypothetical protein
MRWRLGFDFILIKNFPIKESWLSLKSWCQTNQFFKIKGELMKKLLLGLILGLTVSASPVFAGGH